MKRLVLTLLACSALSAQELELSDAARQISAEFRKKNPALDFRATLAVAKFKTSSERLQKNATADLVKASFEKEFMRSVYFEVVERENLERVLSEIELRQKGLTRQKPTDDTLKGAEYLLVGDLTEDGGNLIVSARLVQGTSGAVVATAQSRTPLDSAEQDVSNVQAWEISGVNTTTTVDRRVIVNGTSTWGMTIFKPALIFEYLILKRLSFFFSGGDAFSTMFKPIVYEAGGYRQWDSDTDKNGTFSPYQNFNFARRPDGSPVQFQLGYVFFDIGLSLHF